MVQYVGRKPGRPSKTTCPGQRGLTATDFDPSLCKLVRRFIPPTKKYDDDDPSNTIKAAISDVPAFFLAKFIKKP